MEFGGGVLGLDGLVGSSSTETPPPCLFSSSSSSSYSSCAPLGLASIETEQPMSQKGHFLKHGRPNEEQQEEDNEDDEWSRSLKVARTEAMLLPAAAKAAPFLLRSTPHSLFPDAGEQMLSFSSSPSSKSNAMVITNDGSLPFYQYNHHSSSSAAAAAAAAAAYFYRNAGMVSGGTNVSMHGVRGPFTPSQWLELEQQALIYKYIDAKVPIPSNLLIPFRRSMISPSGLSAYFPGSSYRSTTLGWGSFHLGFSGSADPEPGRCRRTDGKKWRCSRDAVADQKYCERHMNRGRHRSRKLVEGRSGQASRAVPAISTSQPASVGCSGAASNGLNIAQQQTKSLQANTMDPSPSQFNRILMSKERVNNPIQDPHGLSAPIGASQKPASSLFPMSRHHNPFEGTSSGPDFGMVSGDTLLNPSRNSFSESISFDLSSQLDDRQSQTNPLRHFIDDWPKTQSDRPPMAWPEVEDMKSDRTQLSISILTDFSSSSNSPNQEKLALSPLKLFQEFDAINEGNQRLTNWIPISWEPTVGGPLGEVLNNSNNTPNGLSKNCPSSSLNLLTDGWDSSPRLERSPTGVLQETTFGSLSSSTGSSPRADNHRTHVSTSNLCDDLLGSTLTNPPTIPSL